VRIQVTETLSGQRRDLLWTLHVFDGVPTLTGGPADGATRVSLRPRFAFDTGGVTGAAVYVVAIFDAASDEMVSLLPLLPHGQRGYEVQVPPSRALEPNKEYRWMVAAFDSIGWEVGLTFSESRAFTTRSAPLPARVGVRAAASNSFTLDLGGTDRVSAFGSQTDMPVAGDWNGDGRDEIGAFRPGTLRFYLDLDGDGRWDATKDRLTGVFGATGDRPIAGDWNGDGIAEIGVYRPSTMRFLLDLDNSGTATAGDVETAAFGSAGDLPVAGDWDGDGRTEIGIYRPSTRRYTLDLDGSRSIGPGDAVDVGFGNAGDLPIVGDWDGDGSAEIGVYRPSVRRFLMDTDGNSLWSGTLDSSRVYGADGDLPVIGRW
jgi:hypothetical protein